MRSHLLIGYILATCLLSGIMLSGCAQSEVEEVRDYGVPTEDANLVNPFPADDASLTRGEELYKKSCIDCHGEEGRGDGLAAKNLDPQPVDFRADNIIANGIDDSAMMAWGFFDEERRWHLVNYIRSFQE